MKPAAAATLKRFSEIRAELQPEDAAKPMPVSNRNGDGRRLNVPAYCSFFGIEIVKTKDAPGGGTMHCLKHCVFDENHGPNDSSIIQRASGKLSYQCFHASCKDRTWKEARHRISGEDNLDNWMVGGDTAPEKEKHADALVSIGKTAELFMAPGDTMWARFKTGGHRECWQIKSREYQNWVLNQFYKKTGTVPSVMAVKSAMNTLESQAQFAQGESYREVFTRVASYEGLIYLDLADDAWRAVKISSEGWAVVEEPPVCFRRSRGMLPLPVPVRGGSLRLLDRIADLGSDANRKLILSWLSFCVNPFGPYPILCFISEQGSGKSVMSLILRNLIDPNKSPIRGLPTSLEDLAVAGHNSWVPCFDNVSYISDSISDAICRMATGAGFGTRAHYTNHDEALFWGAHPILLNGISEYATRPDLLERSIIVHLPRISPKNRKPEKLIKDGFEQIRPALLGALLDAAVIALKNLPNVSLSEYPRMADFALWAEAAAPAFEAEPAEMQNLLLGKQDEALLSELDAPLPQAVLDLLEARAGKFEGRMSELLTALNDHAPLGMSQKSKWPNSPKGLGSALARLSPVLRVAGVEYQNFGHTRNGTRVLLEKRDYRKPKVLGRDGKLINQSHGPSTQEVKKSLKVGPQRDDCDGSTLALFPSLPSQEKEKKDIENAVNEKVAATPSLPSHRHYPDLLKGEL